MRLLNEAVRFLKLGKVLTSRQKGNNITLMDDSPFGDPNLGDHAIDLRANVRVANRKNIERAADAELRPEIKERREGRDPQRSPHDSPEPPFLEAASAFSGRC